MPNQPPHKQKSSYGEFYYCSFLNQFGPPIATFKNEMCTHPFGQFTDVFTKWFEALLK